jgi:hypothetical protein
MTNSKVKVLYIAGFERSGSTIVNRVLGQIDGFVAMGELAFIWKHDLIDNRKCSCGAFFQECKFWQKVIEHSFGGIEQINPQKIFQLRNKARANVMLNYFGLTSSEFLQSNIEEYLSSLDKLYRGIQSITGSQLIIDSSKVSWYGYILGMLPAIDLYVVHLVRNPHGVCHSLYKRKLKGEPECQWYNTWNSSLSWNLKNSLTEMLLNSNSNRYLRISYESFMQNTKEAIESLLNLVEEQDIQIEDGRNKIQMEVDHILGGSPSSRSETGIVKLNIDEQWKQEMKLVDRACITSLTWPLLLKYGYSSIVNK